MKLLAIATGLLLVIPALPLQAQAPPEVQTQVATGNLVKLQLITTSTFGSYEVGAYSAAQNQTRTPVNNITIYYSILSNSGISKQSQSLYGTLSSGGVAKFNLPTSANTTVYITDIVAQPLKN